MNYPYTNPIRDIPEYGKIPVPPKTKSCAVCSFVFIQRKNQDTFEARQLCDECRKVWKERDKVKDGYRKDV